ncbi:MAG TPA: L-threonylcarbamoyladenylate synthase [Solirubrobacteraceae bacterium]
MKRLRACLRAGGVAVLPTDTVYGLACDPLQDAAVGQLYELKGRPPQRPAAVMFFALDAALDALPELAERERAALLALLPGPLTVLLPNRSNRYPLACGSGALGLRVPRLPERLAALETLDVPVMQSSANLSGGVEARRVADVDGVVLDGADLVLDGGELPGVASTVLDLNDFEREGRWRVVREGPLGEREIQVLLGPLERGAARG